MMDYNDYGFLIKELKAGSESAFDYLFRLLYRNLCHFAYSFLNDRMLAEDVVQGVFEKIWTRKEFIDEGQELENYLYVAVRNSCYTLLKNKKVNVDLGEVDQKKVVAEEMPDNYSELEILRKMIEELPFQCRIVFKLVVFEEMKYQEVASRLGISINTVKTQMKIAYKILREKSHPYRALLLVFYFSRHLLFRSGK